MAEALILPINVVGRADVGRLLREVAAVENFLQQASIRMPGSSMRLPKTSRLFDELVTSNQLNMLRAEDRQRLTAFLQDIQQRAPVLHMSFSADPPPLFIQKLMTYIRREIHPFALVSTGLQPTIGAGCILRTTNKYFDFSLRQRFAAKRQLLLDRLKDSEASTRPRGEEVRP